MRAVILRGPLVPNTLYSYRTPASSHLTAGPSAVSELSEYMRASYTCYPTQHSTQAVSKVQVANPMECFQSCVITQCLHFGYDSLDKWVHVIPTPAVQRVRAAWVITLGCGAARDCVMLAATQKGYACYRKKQS